MLCNLLQSEEARRAREEKKRSYFNLCDDTQCEKYIILMPRVAHKIVDECGSNNNRLILLRMRETAQDESPKVPHLTELCSTIRRCAGGRGGTGSGTEKTVKPPWREI